MHDTILFQKILQSLHKLCKENGIINMTKIDITVPHDSHVQEESLRDYMNWQDATLMIKHPEIKISREDIEESTCIINVVEGDR